MGTSNFDLGGRSERTNEASRVDDAKTTRRRYPSSTHRSPAESRSASSDLFPRARVSDLVYRIALAL